MLKISASTWANEAAFCFTETIPSLMQTPGRYLQLGLSPSLSLFMFWLCIINNHSDWDSGETFPDLTLVGRGKKSVFILYSLFLHMLRDVVENRTSSSSLSVCIFSLLLTLKNRLTPTQPQRKTALQSDLLGYSVLQCNQRVGKQIKKYGPWNKALELLLQAAIIITYRRVSMFQSPIRTHWRDAAAQLPLNTKFTVCSVPDRSISVKKAI